MVDNLAPSWRAVALCILNNDHQLHALGFVPHTSGWYHTIKTLEISMRGGRQVKPTIQLDLPLYPLTAGKV